MVKSKFVKTIIISSCITVLSSNIAFGFTGGGSQPSSISPTQPTITIDRNGGTVDSGLDRPISGAARDYREPSSELEKKQREIDDKLFSKYEAEINKKGFKVVYTGPMDNHIEVAIAPYSNENVEYLYSIIGKDGIKIVEGVEASIMPLVAPDNRANLVNREPVIIDEAMFLRQSEIDKYLFEDYKLEIENKGFTITHTVATTDYVEVGITPFNDENANYLYGKLGNDKVKVVEGELAELLSYAGGNDNVEVDIAATTGLAADTSQKSLLKYGLAAMLLLGSLILVPKTKLLKK